jgi:hypothetical protein
MNSAQIWYVVIQGKANGPHTQKDVLDKLKAGFLHYSDLAFRPGLTQWVPLSECKEFERRLDNEFVTKTALELDVPVENVAGWVLLVKHGSFDGRNHYIQSGPYLSDQVRDKLKKGEISFEDYVWKTGFANWTLIGSLDEFDRRRPKDSEELPKPESSHSETVIAKRSEILAALDGTAQPFEPVTSDIVPIHNDAQKIVAPPIEKIPEVAVKEPLLISKEIKQDTVEKDVDDLKLKNQNSAPIPQMRAEGPADGTQIRPMKKQRLMIGFVGASLAMAITFLGFKGYQQYLQEEEEATRAHEARRMAQAQAALAPHPPAITTAVASAPAKPSKLKLVPLKMDSLSPQLGIDTDLASGSIINVTIKAHPGNILKFPSFLLVRKIEVSGHEMTILDLSREKLPRGVYSFVVEGDGLRNQANLSVGSLDEDFKIKLASFKKQILKQEKSEREAMNDGIKFIGTSIVAFSRAPKSANASAEINSKWIKVLKEWNRQYKDEAKIFKDVVESKRNTFAYPEELLKVKSLETKLKEQANLFYQSLKTKRQVASDDHRLEELKSEAKALQESIKHLPK